MLVVSLVRKIVFLNKIIDKTRKAKNEVNSVTVLEKIISKIIWQNFRKIGLNPKELELLDLAVVMIIFIKSVSEAFMTCLNLSCNSC